MLSIGIIVGGWILSAESFPFVPVIRTADRFAAGFGSLLYEAVAVSLKSLDLGVYLPTVLVQHVEVHSSVLDYMGTSWRSVASTAMVSTCGFENSN